MFTFVTWTLKIVLASGPTDPWLCHTYEPGVPSARGTQAACSHSAPTLPLTGSRAGLLPGILPQVWQGLLLIGLQVSVKT